MLQTGEEQIRLRLLQTLSFAQKKKKKKARKDTPHKQASSASTRTAFV